MPERERVAGVQPAVGELADVLERQLVEREQLLDAGEVEEAVAADIAGDVPERDPVERADRSDEPRPRDARRPRRAQAQRHRERGDRIPARITSAASSESPSAKTTPRAAVSEAALHSTVAETLRRPSAPATSPPGTSRRIVAATSRG